jgi:hypothetical protein
MSEQSFAVIAAVAVNDNEETLPEFEYKTDSDKIEIEYKSDDDENEETLTAIESKSVTLPDDSMCYMCETDDDENYSKLIDLTCEINDSGLNRDIIDLTNDDI